MIQEPLQVNNSKMAVVEEGVYLIEGLQQKVEIKGGKEEKVDIADNQVEVKLDNNKMEVEAEGEKIEVFDNNDKVQHLDNNNKTEEVQRLQVEGIII